MLGALMLAVAAVCVLAGTWQVQRLLEKHRANDQLRANAAGAARPVGEVLATVGEPGAQRRAADAQFRTVTASGTYDTAHQLLVRGRTVDAVVGYLVLTPLRPSVPGAGALLVVRGFLAADGVHAPVLTAPPAGPVEISARLHPGENADDAFGRDPAGQVKTIDPAAAARRLSAPVWDAYAELLPGQPGTAGVMPMPAPDLSNPAGGAVEPQHLAYVVQWYLFALLALSAPLVMARADSRRDAGASADRYDEFDGSVAAPAEEGRIDALEAARRARLADRYGSIRRP